jgi:TPP-dependent pyruvate/acetoin dehydrogenase alpha subunit
MLLGRRFDERMLRLQRQGRIGTFPLIRGQEAAQLGPVAALRPSDWLVPAFREAAAEIWRGRTMENILLYYGGYNQAGHIPDEINNLPTTIPVGTQTLHAVGIGYGQKYRQTDDVAMVFFGDGATSEGDFYKALNLPVRGHRHDLCRRRPDFCGQHHSDPGTGLFRGPAANLAARR